MTVLFLLISIVLTLALVRVFQLLCLGSMLMSRSMLVLRISLSIMSTLRPLAVRLVTCVVSRTEETTSSHLQVQLQSNGLTINLGVDVS